MALGATPYRRDSWDAIAKTGIGFSPDDKLNSSSRKSNPFFFIIHLNHKYPEMVRWELWSNPLTD